MQKVFKIVKSGYKALGSHSLLGDLISLGFGQVGVKLIAFVGTIAAVRGLGPSQMGNAGVVTAFAGALGLLVNLGVDVVGPRAISSAESGIEQKRLILGFLAARFVVSLVAVIVLPFYVIFRGEYGLVGVAISGAVLVIVNGQVVQFAFQGLGLVRRIASVQLLTAIVALPVNLCVAKFFPTAEAYLLAQAVVVGVSVTYSWVLIGLSLKLVCYNALKTAKCWVSSTEGKSAWLSVIVMFALGQGDMFSVTIFCDRGVIGNFSAALALIAATNGIIGIIPTVVYAKQLAWVKAGRELFDLNQRRLLLITSLAAGALGVVCVPLGFYAGSLVLGKQFLLAPKIFAIILGISLISLPYGVMSSALNSLGLSQKNLKVTLVISLGALALYPLAAYFYSLNGVLGVKVILALAMTAMQFRIYRKSVNV